MISNFSRILKVGKHDWIISDMQHYNYEVPTSPEYKSRILIEVSERKDIYL